MNAVLIIIPQDADKSDIINTLEAVLKDLTNNSTIRPGFHVFNTDPECMRMTIVCDNLINKLGYPIRDSIAWVSSFFQAYYNANDIDITSEVIEYIANVSEKERQVMISRNLDFLIPICRNMCNKN